MVLPHNQCDWQWIEESHLEDHQQSSMESQYQHDTRNVREKVCLGVTQGNHGLIDEAEEYECESARVASNGEFVPMTNWVRRKRVLKERQCREIGKDNRCAHHCDNVEDGKNISQSDGTEHVCSAAMVWQTSRCIKTHTHTQMSEQQQQYDGDGDGDCVRA